VSRQHQLSFLFAMARCVVDPVRHFPFIRNGLITVQKFDDIVHSRGHNTKLRGTLIFFSGASCLNLYPSTSNPCRGLWYDGKSLEIRA